MRLLVPVTPEVTVIWEMLTVVSNLGLCKLSLKCRVASSLPQLGVRDTGHCPVLHGPHPQPSSPEPGHSRRPCTFTVDSQGPSY